MATPKKTMQELVEAAKIIIEKASVGQQKSETVRKAAQAVSDKINQERGK